MFPQHVCGGRRECSIRHHEGVPGWLLVRLWIALPLRVFQMSHPLIECEEFRSSLFFYVTVHKKSFLMITSVISVLFYSTNSFTEERWMPSPTIYRVSWNIEQHRKNTHLHWLIGCQGLVLQLFMLKGKRESWPGSPTEVKSQLCHLLALWPRASYVASFWPFSFPTYKKRR